MTGTLEGAKDTLDVDSDSFTDDKDTWGDMNTCEGVNGTIRVTRTSADDTDTIMRVTGTRFEGDRDTVEG